MSGFLCDFVNNRVLDCYFGGKAIVPPRRLYFGLARNPANKPGSFVEPSAESGYVRVLVPNDSSSFASAKQGMKTNKTVVTFAQPTDEWGVILSVFIVDSPRGGNTLAMYDLDEPLVVHKGDVPPKISVGGLLYSHT